MTGDNSGPWTYKDKEQQIYHTKKGQCLALEPESSRLIMRDCDGNNAYHKWVWKELVPYWSKKKTN